MLKEEKARNHSWRRHACLSTEDPFEVGYDVGHVLRKRLPAAYVPSLHVVTLFLQEGLKLVEAPAVAGDV